MSLRTVCRFQLSFSLPPPPQYNNPTKKQKQPPPPFLVLTRKNTNPTPETLLPAPAHNQPNPSPPSPPPQKAKKQQQKTTHPVNDKTPTNRTPHSPPPRRRLRHNPHGIATHLPAPIFSPPPPSHPIQTPPTETTYLTKRQMRTRQHQRIRNTAITHHAPGLHLHARARARARAHLPLYACQADDGIIDQLLAQLGFC